MTPSCQSPSRQLPFSLPDGDASSLSMPGRQTDCGQTDAGNTASPGRFAGAVAQASPAGGLAKLLPAAPLGEPFAGPLAGASGDPRVRGGLARAESMARRQGRLLFLTIFGSALYGTALPGKSDVDLRGVYLADDPKGAESAPGLHWSSGTDDARNGAGDCDIDLVSLERWLLRDLPAGDTAALDLLFAPGNKACTLVCDPSLASVFARPLAFLRLEEGSACASYVRRQGKKYGLQGTRLGGLWRMARFLENVDPGVRLASLLGDLAASAMAPESCFVGGTGVLSAGGKIFEPGLKAGEARRRLLAMLKEHLERIEAAREGRGVDWKALSHGLRAIRQQEELLAEGTLRFPLDFRDEVLAVKTAGLGFAEVEAMLVQGLERLESLRKQSRFAGTLDPAYAETCIAAVRRGAGRQPPGIARRRRRADMPV